MSETQKEEYDAKSKIITAWIEDLLKVPIPGNTLEEKLSDGVFLCQIANALKPGCIRKFHRGPKMLMMKLENIAIAKSRFNIPQNELFELNDITEAASSHDPAIMLRVIRVLSLMIAVAGLKVSGLEDISTPELSSFTPQEQQQDQRQSYNNNNISNTSSRPLSLESIQKMMNDIVIENESLKSQLQTVLNENKEIKLQNENIKSEFTTVQSRLDKIEELIARKW